MVLNSTRNKPQESTINQPVIHAAILLLFFAGCLPCIGCHSRTLTPELEYSDSEVELIEKEIEAIEW